MDRTWVEQQLATMESRETDYAQRISIATYLVKHIAQAPDPLDVVRRARNAMADLSHDRRVPLDAAAVADRISRELTVASDVVDAAYRTRNLV